VITATGKRSAMVELESLALGATATILILEGALVPVAFAYRTLD
jgi:hypothetical protein